ncbi:hypothetical protein GBK02_10010 [Dechloromonas sp. TW-R-39-2]|uniref:hypothetical protein n=1 Tax=Dechloromonas sp. TW-R-39-2 TaxID=2654218 RepID=UPI00193DC796|nr:hypothetical protein [Dechloromonas sp. TW-R-39-2]QRM19712.1 hypothetical protein GBK02_10010 [Dechloromonas sp. TW-R-39-2]
MSNIDKFRKSDWQITAEAKMLRLESVVSTFTAAAEVIYQTEVFGPSMALQKLQDRRKELAATPIPRGSVSEKVYPDVFNAQIETMISGLDAVIEAHSAQIAEAKTRQNEALEKAKDARALKERALFAYQRATGNIRYGNFN